MDQPFGNTESYYMTYFFFQVSGRWYFHEFIGPGTTENNKSSVPLKQKAMLAIISLGGFVYFKQPHVPFIDSQMFQGD